MGSARVPDYSQYSNGGTGVKEIVTDKKALPSTSPVAQATKGGGFVFVGGQMPRDFATGKIVEGAEVQVSAIGEDAIVEVGVIALA